MFLEYILVNFQRKIQSFPEQCSCLHKKAQRFNYYNISKTSCQIPSISVQFCGEKSATLSEKRTACNKFLYNKTN
jgi:hypothetical protein